MEWDIAYRSHKNTRGCMNRQGVDLYVAYMHFHDDIHEDYIVIESVDLNENITPISKAEIAV